MSEQQDIAATATPHEHDASITGRVQCVHGPLDYRAASRIRWAIERAVDQAVSEFDGCIFVGLVHIEREGRPVYPDEG